MKETETKQEKRGAPKFTKEQILVSARYSCRRDILAELLEDNKQYSADEADALLDKFMKGKVK